MNRHSEQYFYSARGNILFFCRAVARLPEGALEKQSPGDGFT